VDSNLELKSIIHGSPTYAERHSALINHMSSASFRSIPFHRHSSRTDNWHKNWIWTFSQRGVSWAR